MIPVPGLPDFRPGDDLAALIAAAAPWLEDGDVVVVTSKAVSKVEGRLLPAPADPAGREAARQRAVDGGDRPGRRRPRPDPDRADPPRPGAGGRRRGRQQRTVRRAGPAAGGPGRLGPGAARAAEARRSGRTVAVVVSDTMGRPWRTGVVDVAIGAAGVRAVEDLRGATDTHGLRLEMTEVAVADELAAAAELAKGKLTAVPVAVVRGLSPVDDPRRRRCPAAAVRAGPVPARHRRGDRGGPARGTVRCGRCGAAGARRRGRPAGRAGTTRTRASESVGQALLSFLLARPDATRRACRPGHLTASTLVLDATGEHVLLTLHKRIGAWVVARRPHRARGRHRAGRGDPGGAGGERDRRPGGRPRADLPRRAPGHLLARHPDPAPGRDLPGGGAAGCATGAQRRVRGPAWFPVGALPDGVVPDLPALLARGVARLGGRG